MKTRLLVIAIAIICGVLISPVYAGGNVGSDLKKVAVTKSVSLPKVEIARVSLVDAVKAYFSMRFGFSIIKDGSKEPTKPSEPQKGWGYRPVAGKEYIIIRDNGGEPAID